MSSTNQASQRPEPSGGEGIRGYFVPVAGEPGDSVRLGDLWLEIGGGKWVILLLGLLGLAAGLAYAFTATPVYRAEALVAPVSSDDQGGLGSLGREFGGIASLAGIDLGGGSDSVEESLAVLTSRSFARSFIDKNNLLPVLYGDDWSSLEADWKANPEPVVDEAVKRFREDIQRVVVDGSSGLITVAAEWREPDQAAVWANSMVNQVNERLRLQAVDESNASITYLNRELEEASVVDLRQAIFRLIEGQINKKMMANVRRDYVFKVLDPAVAPGADDHVRPRKVLATAGGLVAGLTLGIVYVLLVAPARRSRKDAA